MKNSRYNANFIAGSITISGSGELSAVSPPFCGQNPKILDQSMQDIPEQWDDAKLLQEALAGNKAAWDEFIRRYGALLWMIARKYARYVPGPDVAEDFFQEICLHIIKNAHRWKPSGNFRHYLSRMALRKAIDLLRKMAGPHSKMVSLDDSERPLDIPAPNPDNETQMILQEQEQRRQKRMKKCIECLSPLKRKVLKDKIAGRDPVEAAKEMGITVNHWRVLAYRAEQYLKNCVNGKEHKPEEDR